ncbi:hypothetical protein RKD19_003096 [Streptomyces canus]|uniref:hypothetical protein n=1 Tax=unclassified Streptomyces TaxID=2593676 RepID=UPI000F6468AB|nr:hypothetical protein [Streptomyces sp. RP5T]RRR76578.1 hypothetical protein EHS43_30365 [Streptomyces sp. RP5T]
MADRWSSRRMGCAVLSATALLLAACSGEEKPEVAYALPDTLCGAHVGKQAIEPLFPPGSKLTHTGDALDNGKYASGCDYAVDNAKKLLVSSFFHEDTPTARQIAEKRATEYGSGNKKVTVEASGDVALYSRGAVAVAACPGYSPDAGDLPRTSFSVEILAFYPKDLSKADKTLTQLVKKLVPVVAKANGC